VPVRYAPPRYADGLNPGAVGADLDLSGNLEAANITAEGDLTIELGSLIALQDASIGSSLTVGGTSTAQGGHVGAYAPSYPDTVHDTGALLSTAGRCYAYYAGTAPRDLTSIYVAAYMGTAAVAGGGGAALNWAEIGIAVGTLEADAAGAATDLTIRGYASINAEAIAGAANFAEKEIAGINIPAGTGLWVVVAASYQTTQAGFRSFDGVQPNIGRFRAACQPSLNLGVPLAFTDAAYVVAIPQMRRKVL
jgi:hypothetical protein